MHVFSEEVLLLHEREAIKAWTRDSSNIKQAMWGNPPDEKSSILARTLFELFERYTSNLAKGTRLYRGMSIPDHVFAMLGYDTLKVGDSYSPDELAVTSFTRSKRVAYEFARDGAFAHKVLIVLPSGDGMLDIASLSTEVDEQEIILMQNLWYTVTRVKDISTGGSSWKIIILK